MNFSHFLKLREEPLKNAIQEEFFDGFRYTQLGNIDFVIAEKRTDNRGNLFGLFSFLWAEAKKGNKCDIYESFVQLILTIGKKKTFEKELPPRFIGALDAEKIAFIEYNDIQGVFYQNDFNWNVTPSDHNTKEFKQLYENCQKLLEKNTFLFNFGQQEKELREFIRKNFKASAEETAKIAVTKNNFTFVFRKWTDKVMPTIGIRWDEAKKVGILSADFFLADLISRDDESIKDNLYVVLRKTKYELAKKIDELGMETSRTALFNDRQKAYREFWAIYERPPKEEYWDYIIGRRDLLVPQDIRERKGSFFTPQIWVEKSQQYIADVLGENWQDEYYVWDCCAGTGNLLDGLTNKYKIFASTLDQADVDVMKDRVKNGWNMLENHIFQFDFLNDEFTKCPEALQKIINDPEKRKKLLIYINPPYAEAANATMIIGQSANKTGVSTSNKTYGRYKEVIGDAANELFAQFLIRIYEEIQCCKIGNFATLKALCASNFADFRNVYLAKLEKLFLVPGASFDNVTGKFPIGFHIWDSAKKEQFSKINADVYDLNGNKLQPKIIWTYSNVKLISKWYSLSYDKKSSFPIGVMNAFGNDFQQQSRIHISSKDSKNHTNKITSSNLVISCVYFSVRQSIEADWLNDRDQFLYPNDGWQNDDEFQSNCLIYTLFHGQNKITSTQGTNHWIPFVEDEVSAREEFESHFMSDYLKGKIDTKQTGQADLFSIKQKKPQNIQIQLSPEAQKVFDAGRELWRYYHSKQDANPNASLYDIKEYFQGRDEKGRMKTKSDDEEYTKLLNELKAAMKALGEKIKPKVYEHGFLVR